MKSRRRLWKLRAMSRQELLSRLRYRLAVGAERCRWRMRRLSPEDRLERALRPPLGDRRDWREELLARHRARCAAFYPSVAQRERMRGLFDDRYARELGESRRLAERARRHEFEFFGAVFRYGPAIDWQRDPQSDRRWPARFHADVPVADTRIGDVKYVWELNRHQFLVDLAKAYFLDGNACDAAAVRDLVRSWLHDNPYGVGVGWANALEPAFRTFSWLWAYHLCLDDADLDVEFHTEWLTGFYDHGRFLAAHLEYDSSPFNHLIGEAAALFALGSVFDELHEAEAWRIRGRRILESRIDAQFYADGGSVEQSICYQHATLSFYVQAALLARASGDEFSPHVWETIERAVEFSTRLAQPDRSHPQIGDADDGRPLRMEHVPASDYRSLQAVGAVLFDRTDFKHAAGRFHEDALWLLGPSGLDRFAAMRATPPPATSQWLPHSGYAVMRSDWSTRADYVCFDAGPQAAGIRRDGIPSAAHGHADCLSVIVWLGGRPVLVDPGCYCYNGERPWQDHFRGTAAHSTLTVDARAQARQVGPMTWSHTYEARLDAWLHDGRQTYAMARHDGYARRPNGVLHRRLVWLRPGGYVLIFDEVVGAGSHEVELTFQFAEGTARLTDGQQVLFDERVELQWLGTAALSPRLRHGDPGPDGGWVAPSLGVRRPAPRLTLAGRFDAPTTRFLTVAADRGDLDAPRVERVANALVVRGPDYRDWVTIGEVAPAHAAPFATDATLALCRVRDDAIEEAVRLGGSFLTARTLAAAAAMHTEPEAYVW